jgi:hypothetical protein
MHLGTDFGKADPTGIHQLDRCGEVLVSGSLIGKDLSASSAGARAVGLVLLCVVDFRLGGGPSVRGGCKRGSFFGAETRGTEVLRVGPSGEQDGGGKAGGELELHGGNLPDD